MMGPLIAAVFRDQHIFTRWADTATTCAIRNSIDAGELAAVNG